jgi:hypothetical protein
MINSDLKNLKKRYLIWFYKFNKEALDKIERKFTQVEIDRFIIKELKKADKEEKASNLIAEFQEYVSKKEAGGVALKFNGKQLKEEYLFLALKNKAIEKAIIREFGTKGLKEIKSLYEKEMTERILKSTEH